MLPKQHRLTKKKDFKLAIGKGRSFFVKDFGIKFMPRKSGMPYSSKCGLMDVKRPTRIGIVIPKKIAKTIIKRNRIKRQLRHIFLKLIDDLAQGYDIVFFVRPDFLQLKSKDMQEKIVSVLKRIRLIESYDPLPQKFRRLGRGYSH